MAPAGRAFRAARMGGGDHTPTCDCVLYSVLTHTDISDEIPIRVCSAFLLQVCSTAVPSKINCCVQGSETGSETLTILHISLCLYVLRV